MGSLTATCVVDFSYSFKKKALTATELDEATSEALRQIASEKDKETQEPVVETVDLSAVDVTSVFEDAAKPLQEAIRFMINKFALSKFLQRLHQPQQGTG